MGKGAQTVTRWSGRILAGLLCAFVAGACDFRPSAPESRAEYFVGKLIREPQAIEELQSIARLAEGAGPDSLADDLPTRTALNYLRARQRLGAKFGLHVADSQRLSSGGRLVTVAVSEATAVLNERAVVQFQVELKKQADDWLVTRLHSD